MILYVGLQVASSKPHFPDEFDVANITPTPPLLHHLAHLSLSLGASNVHVDQDLLGEQG